MAWIEIADTNLNDTQRDNNALMVYAFYHPLGWTTESIAAMAGNMSQESTLNPIIRSNPAAGAYGLTQLTYHKYDMINWCNNNGYNPATGNGQCAYYEYQRGHPETDQWYGRNEFRGVTFSDFAYNNVNYTLEQLTRCFWQCYENSAGYNPRRYRYAARYYQLYTGGPTPPITSIPPWLLWAMKKHLDRYKAR